MRDRFDVGAALMHLAVVLTVLSGVLLVVGRQVVPALTGLAVATGLFVLGRRLPPPATMPELTGPAVAPGPVEAPVPVRHIRTEPAPAADDEDTIPRLPPPPAGRAVRGWAPPRRRVRVSSTPRHSSALARARRRAPGPPAVLVSDVSSPHHPYAVAVYVGPDYVGDLQGDDLLDYGPALAGLVPHGIDISAEALFTSRTVDVSLPEPGALVPVNALPHGVVLPHGSPLAVRTADDDSAGARLLTRYSRPGEDVWLAVTLHATLPPRGRGPAREVEVRLDGVPVGTLDTADVADMTPLLAYLGDHDTQPVAAACLRGSSLHRALTLSCIRAQDADDDWLRALA